MTSTSSGPHAWWSALLKPRKARTAASSASRRSAQVQWSEAATGADHTPLTGVVGAGVGAMD
ncbi:hypothetical protein AWH69_10675 [Janibacter melonis]|uniref:Uncharacterized protein n=1 Tax=Janibacter melonis TaxID=262209 RepID=A0A176QAV5_9MICO|nr:hypothetical protein AWH69_10675 [Janibacter melonis]